MADFIFIRKSRNAFSSFLHISLNILLGVGSIFITLVSGSWLLGILLVLLSKWRIFAVRPRFWFTNIKSNLVDLIVGFSLVLIAYVSGTDLLPVHFILAGFYIIWLLIIKPRTASNWNLIQSMLAIFLGSSAAILVTSDADVIFLVLAELIIGYGSARHVFAQSSEKLSISLISFICALICAEVAWLCHSWNIIYPFNSLGILIPQLSIILTIISFTFAVTVRSIFRHDGQFSAKEIAPPVIFSLVTIGVIIFVFSNPIFNI